LKDNAKFNYQVRWVPADQVLAWDHIIKENAERAAKEAALEVAKKREEEAKVAKDELTAFQAVAKKREEEAKKREEDLLKKMEELQKQLLSASSSFK